MSPASLKNPVPVYRCTGGFYIILVLVAYWTMIGFQMSYYVRNSPSDMHVLNLNP